MPNKKVCPESVRFDVKMEEIVHMCIYIFFQGGVPNGARRSQPQSQPDSAEDERIAELVKKAG